MNRWMKMKMVSAYGLSLTRPKSPLLRPSRFSSGERRGTTVGELGTANHQVPICTIAFCKQRIGYSVDVDNWISLKFLSSQMKSEIRIPRKIASFPLLNDEFVYLEYVKRKQTI